MNVERFGDVAVPQCQGIKKGPWQSAFLSFGFDTTLKFCFCHLGILQEDGSGEMPRGGPCVSVFNSNISSLPTSWIFFLSLERSFT